MSPNVIRKASFLSVIFTKKFHATASTSNPFSKQFFPSQKKKKILSKSWIFIFTRLHFRPTEKYPKGCLTGSRLKLISLFSLTDIKKYYFEQEKKDKTFQHVELEVISDWFVCWMVHLIHQLLFLFFSSIYKEIKFSFSRC